MRKIQPALATSIILAFMACSHPDPSRLMTPQLEIESPAQNNDQQPAVSGDSSTVEADQGEYDREIDRAEYYYAQGVGFFQMGVQDSAQQAYEQALEIISDIDIDPAEYPDQALRVERLLNEIEQDYRLTLLATGVLFSESSVSAFRELFDDVKNFKKLKESNAFRTIDKSDTVSYDIAIEWNNKVVSITSYSAGPFLNYFPQS